jgi:hypothetical protein
VKRILMTAVAALALAVPAGANAAAGGDQFEDGGGGCGQVGRVENRDSWRWYAYTDGGGYVRLWTDAWLCTGHGWDYVGGWWN